VPSPTGASAAFARGADGSIPRSSRLPAITTIPATAIHRVDPALAKGLAEPVFLSIMAPFFGQKTLVEKNTSAGILMIMP
jgi:hypothetical protein